jgi:hypothetical protein
MSSIDPKDLVIVAGHAAFKSNVSSSDLGDPSDDELWCLQSFQIGEVPFYLEHARRGVVLAAHNPAALLILSGGRTRRDALPWSEAGTYLEVARANRWWIPDGDIRSDIEGRTFLEEYARDSFENLLFGICRFHQVRGKWPRNVTLVSWAFKEARFELHRAAMKFPASRFRFDGFNAPIDLEGAQRGERAAIADFIKSPFGATERLLEKRLSRTFGGPHSYDACLGAEAFFAHIETSAEPFEEILPWAD